MRTRLLLVFIGFAVCACVDESPTTPISESRTVPFAASALKTEMVADHVVIPTGDVSADVANVQAAVDLGGTVLLKATNASGVPTAFNFGPPSANGRVFIGRRGHDVTIVGETVQGLMTTIYGGNFPVRMFFPLRLAIRGIAFDKPYGPAVFIDSSTRFEFTHSYVRNVLPVFFWTDAALGPVYGTQAIWTSNYELSGPILIADNVFENCGVNGAILGYGLKIDPGNADVRIARNVIRGANLAGIIIFPPIRPVVIEDNVIVTGPGDAHPRLFGNGIHMGGGAQTKGPGDIIARNNDITVEGPEAFGIFMFGDAIYNGPIETAVVENNRIHIRDGWLGIGLFGLVANSRVMNNQIRGNAQYALGLPATPEDDAHDPAIGNVFVGNNTATFTAAIADVVFDAHTRANVLAGHSGTVIDLGTDNRITGVHPDGPKQIGHYLKNTHERNRLINAAVPAYLFER